MGGERFELPQPKPRLYRPVVSPMNSPPVGCQPGIEPGRSRVTAEPRNQLGSGTSAPRRNRTSVPWVWARCSPIELAEQKCAHEDSNPDLQIRNLMSYPLNDRRMVAAPRTGRGPFAVSGRRSATELCGCGGNDNLNSLPPA